MKTIHRIGIGALVGLCFAFGYVARATQAHKAEIAAQKNEVILDAGRPVASTNLNGIADVDLSPSITLYDVLTKLRQRFVEQLTPEIEGEMTHDALKAMLASLNDGYSRFLSSDIRQALLDEQEGKYHGIGAVLGIQSVKSSEFEFSEERLVVISTLPGSPAASAGLKTGDTIVAIDGDAVLPYDPLQRALAIIKEGKGDMTDIEWREMLEKEQKRVEDGIPIVKADSMLDTQDGKTIELAVERDGEKKKITVETGTFDFEPVEYSKMSDKNIGYVKIHDFSNGAADDFGDALQALVNDGCSGLVIDLRNVASGKLDVMKNMAGYLLPEKTVTVIAEAHNKKTSVKAPAKDLKFDGKIAVVADGGTAAVAEVFAGAIKQQLGAKVVGEDTYGEFRRTSVLDLPDGSAVVYISGKYLGPDGKEYKDGIAADYKVLSQDSGGDPQLEKAVELLRKS